MFKSIFIALILSISFQASYAQGSGIRKLNKEDKREIDFSNDKVRIGITPSALLNNYLGIQFNTGITLSEKFQFNLEGGWVVSSSAFNNQNTTGLRFRPSLKYYINRGVDYRLHMSLGYHIRNTRADRTSSFTATNGSFLGMASYEQERKVKGFAFMFGVDHWLSDRIVLDTSLGFGVGKIEITDIGTPPNSLKETFFFSNDDPGISNYPILILNIKFQYIIL